MIIPPIVPTVVFTTLPRFTRDGLYHFSLHVAPRLDPPGTLLEDYSLGNWPNAVLGMAAAKTLWLQFGAAANPLIPCVVETAQLRPDLWDQLFPPATTFVRPYEFKDNALRPIYSFSVSTLEAYFESLYGQVANASPTDFPNLKGPGPLNDLAQSMGRGLPIMRKGIDRRSQEPGPHPDLDIETELDNLGLPVPLAELYRALRFYTRGNAEKWSDFNYRSQHEPSVPALIPEPIKPPTIDFHQVMAMLGDHPFLMRALGLVIDVSISERDLGGALPAFGRVRAQVQWGPMYPATTDKTPWTHYEQTATTFLPRARKTGDIVAGFLKLNESQRFDVFQTDADGNALKTLDFAANMHSKLVQLLTIPVGETQPWVPVQQPAPESLPAQRNGGLTVVRKERDKKIFFDVEQQRDINSVIDVAEVEYDDVARGYRIDVNDRGTWRSLCFRQGKYLFGGIADPVVPDKPDEGYVKAASATSDPAANATPNGPMYLHEAVFGWDNWSLVAPRPGQTISFERDDTTRTQTLKIERPENKPPPEFDLVPAFSVVPKTLPRMRFGQRYQFRARVVDLAGNSLDYQEADVAGAPVSKTVDYLRYEPLPVPVFVLREAITAGESVEHLVVRTRVGDLAPNDPALFNDECLRFVAPPKVSQFMAELHGCFDPYWGDPQKAYDIAVKEAGTLNDPGLPNIDVLDINGNSVGFPAEFKRGDALPNHHYAVHTGSSLELPYLPDPLSVGFVLQGLGASIVRDFAGTGSWPDYEPFSLTLGKTMSPAPVLAPLPDFTEIDLPPATILKLKYSSAIETGGLKVMARWHTLNAAMQAQVLASANQHWMMTPFRIVTLVHAVEKPLEEPIFYKSVGFARLPGQTFVTMTRGQFQCHSRSTGQLETFARWTEFIDRVDDPAPVTEPRDGRVFETKVNYDEAIVEFGPERHEFGDTKHRMVQYYPVGTTRYREYFPASITSRPELITLEGPPYEPVQGVEFVNVPSSALPDPPRVLYIVPTFKWVESGDGLTRERVGRGLRIYLDRPWYSSGEGELVGIVISRPGDPLTPDLRRFVSEWGADPVYQSSGPINPLKFADFVPDPDAPDFTPVSGTNLKVPERDVAVLVNVVGIKPEFNPDRKLWFVDLELNTGSSFAPFVRFSLCRYQPSSLNGFHLSKFVKTEFAQLLADRTATLQHVGANDLEITLSGPAARNQIGAFLPMPSGPPVPVIDDPLGPTARAQVKPVPLPVPDPGPIIVNPGPFYVKDAYAGAGRIVRAHFERLDNEASEDFGWVSASNVYVLESYTSIFEPGVVSWMRTIPKPAGWETSGKRHRLVIGESEFFQTDEDTSHPVPVFNPSAIPLRERLVYVDTFELT